MASPRHRDSTLRPPWLGLDRAIVVALLGTPGLVAWQLAPNALQDLGWSVVWTIVALALVGLWMQGGRVSPAARRPLLFDGAVRYPLGIALTLPALAFVTWLPLLAPEVLARPDTLVASLLASGLGLWLGVGQSMALVSTSAWVRRRGVAHRRRLARLHALADAVERAIARVDVDDDRGAQALAWASREIHDSLGTDAHILLRAGDVRVQIFECVIQVWHPAHRLELDVEMDVVASVPAGVRLDLEGPDRYLLRARSSTPGLDDAQDLAQATAALVAALATRSRPAVDAEPLHGTRRPARTPARLTVRSVGGVLYVVDGDRLCTQRATRSRHPGVVGVDLSRPFRVLVGRDEATDRSAVVVTLRQRIDMADADPEPHAGLVLEAGAGEPRWAEVRFAVEVASLPTALASSLPLEQAPPSVVLDGVAFQALWRLVYWRALEHGTSVPALPAVHFGTRGALDAGLRKPRARRPRGVSVAASLRTWGTVALASFLVAHLIAGVVSTDLGFPVWEPRSVATVVTLLASIVLLGVVQLLGFGRQRLDDLVASGLRDGLGVIQAIDPAIDVSRLTPRVPDSRASVEALAATGRRVDGVLQSDGVVWGRLSMWCAERWLGIPVLTEQLEIHVDTTRDGGPRLATDLARLQMRLLDSGVAAVVVRSAARATLALSVTRRIGARRRPWARLATHLRRLQADERRNPMLEGVATCRPMWPTPPRSVGTGRVRGSHPITGLAAAAAAVAATALFVCALPTIGVEDHPVARSGAPDLAMAQACPPARGGRVDRLDSLRCVVNAAGYRGPLRDATPQRVLPLVDDIWAPPGGHLVPPGMLRHARGRWFDFVKITEARQGAPLGLAMAAQGLPGWADFHKGISARLMGQLRPPAVFDEPSAPWGPGEVDASGPTVSLGDRFVTAAAHELVRVGPDEIDDTPLFVSARPLVAQVSGLFDPSRSTGREGVVVTDALSVCLSVEDLDVQARCLCGTLGGELPRHGQLQRLLGQWPTDNPPERLVVQRPGHGVMSCDTQSCSPLTRDYGVELYCTLDPLAQLNRSRGRSLRP